MAYPMSQHDVKRYNIHKHHYFKDSDSLFNNIRKRASLFKAVALYCHAKLAEEVLYSSLAKELLGANYAFDGFYVLEDYLPNVSSYQIDDTVHARSALETQVVIPDQLFSLSHPMISWPLLFPRKRPLRAVLRHTNKEAVALAASAGCSYSSKLEDASSYLNVAEIQNYFNGLNLETQSNNTTGNPLNGLLVFQTFARILVTEASKQPSAIKKWLLDVISYLNYDQLLPRTSQIELQPPTSESSFTGVENTGQFVGRGEGA